MFKILSCKKAHIRDVDNIAMICFSIMRRNNKWRNVIYRTSELRVNINSEYGGNFVTKLHRNPPISLLRTNTVTDCSGCQEKYRINAGW